MIDIHSHILPMVDDGASSIESALKMLIQAYEDGTDVLFLTPHFATAYGFDNPKEKIRELFDQFCDIVDDHHIPIQLYLGCEYLYQSKEVFENEVKYIQKMNNTKYVLVEFYFDVHEDIIFEAVDVIKSKGLIPILAHPERYDCIQEDPNIAYELRKSHVYLQMNKGSILGRYGRKVERTCLDLLVRDCYKFVGSDAHHPKLRSPIMSEAIDKVEEIIDEMEEEIEDLEEEIVEEIDETAKEIEELISEMKTEE